MALNLQLDFSEFQLLEGVVAELSGLMDDLTPEWRQVVDVLGTEFEKVFEQEGPGWKPLAESTRANRRRHGYGASHPILVRTGALKSSWTTYPNVVLEPDFMIYAPGAGDTLGGTPVDLATINEYGTDRIPARPVINEDKLSPVVQRVVEDSLINRVNQVWHKRTGRGRAEV